ncbi:hypothetical protein HYC85_029369 [Camellia sinensis]|uniref:RRM domain-containing protein n=1 Tax=Camellia sinensis TaxID=4442 RepID=A0A7J7G084_CAMSI|nr:hypothetical protein HYC85_029369 [Camellia sinensis]
MVYRLITGLSYDTNESVLKDAFGQHGEIIEAVKVICDHVTGKSKGYGFVQFNSETAAGTALREMDGETYTHSLWTQGVMTDVYAFIMDTRGDHKEPETTNGSSGILGQASPQTHQRSSFGSHEMQPSNQGK